MIIFQITNNFTRSALPITWPIYARSTQTKSIQITKQNFSSLRISIGGKQWELQFMAINRIYRRNKMWYGNLNVHFMHRPKSNICSTLAYVGRSFV